MFSTLAPCFSCFSGNVGFSAFEGISGFFNARFLILLGLASGKDTFGTFIILHCLCIYLPKMGNLMS